jgi:hypothetical protein
MADEAGRQVQAALHTAGVVLGRAVGGIGQVELPQQLGCAAAGFRPAQVEEPPDDLEVLAAGEFFLDGGRLPGQPDGAADRGRLLHDVTALDQRAPAIRP